MQRSRGGQATWQDADFEQRIYQAHPSRRAAAEPCMQLHPTKYGCGELQREWPQPPVAAALSPASPAALEAAWRIYTRRDALARFLLRKEQEEAHDAAVPPQRHPKASGRQYAVQYVAPTPEALRAVDAQLLALAALLAGLRECSVDSEGAEGEAGAEGEESRSRVLLHVDKCTKLEAAVARLGGLVGTPRDMSSAAAAELRAALQLMSEQ